MPPNRTARQKVIDVLLAPAVVLVLLPAFIAALVGTLWYIATVGI